MTFPDERSPSSDPAILAGQLQRELEALRNRAADPEEPRLCEAYARQVLAESWRRVGEGDSAAPGEFLGRLEGVQTFVNAFLPAPDEPRAEAARAMHQLLVELALAARSVRPAQLKTWLADRKRSAGEREVLRVLFENRRRYLRRGEVHAAMSPARGSATRSRAPGAVRVGQILVDLHHEGLLVRTERPAQGNPTAGFYALSEAGVEVCRELGIPDERSLELPPLFFVPDEAERGLLRPERVATPGQGFARPANQIATFYSYRGGLGRSLAVAHCGLLLAGHHRQEGGKVLLMDLDLEAPGLHEYFAAPPDAKGFEGLLADYFARGEEERRAWLTTALTDPAYVVQVGSVPNLFLLPSASAAAPAGEIGEVTERLRHEVSRSRRLPQGRPALSENGFLADLAAALHAVYRRVLIDAPAGLSSASFASAALLADELVLCLRPNTSPVDGLRRVLASFLWRDRGDSGPPLVTFVFTPFPGEAPEIRPPRWIEERLLSDPGVHAGIAPHFFSIGARAHAGAAKRIYRIVRIYHSKELAVHKELLVDAQGNWTERAASDLLLKQGYYDLATLIRSAIVDPDLPSRIEKEIVQLSDTAGDRAAHGGAVSGHRPSAMPERAGDLVMCSSGGDAAEAIEALAMAAGS